jgi:hypothetical protein
LTLTFRRDLSRNLTAAEVDGNFDDLNGRTVTLEGGMASGGIASFTISGSIITITFTDATSMSVDIGTANAYAMSNHCKGIWQPTTAYVVNDIFFYQGSLYCVNTAHTSASTFDENAGPYTLIVRYGDGVAAVSSSTFTPSAASANKYIRMTNSGGCAITLPGNVFKPADRMTFRQGAAGGLSLVAGSGVTINGMSGYLLTTSLQGAAITAMVVGPAEYDVWGMFDGAP